MTVAAEEEGDPILWSILPVLVDMHPIKCGLSEQRVEIIVRHAEPRMGAYVAAGAGTPRVRLRSAHMCTGS